MLGAGNVETFEFKPPGSDRTYLAAAHPITVGGETFGALVVAKPRTRAAFRLAFLSPGGWVSRSSPDSPSPPV